MGWSVAGTLSLLRETDHESRVSGLKKLNSIVHQHWPESSEYIIDIQEMSEDKTFPDRKLAALVASRIFFHLGDSGTATRYALVAGDAFDVFENSDYALTVTARIVDDYITKQQQLFEDMEVDKGEHFDATREIVDTVFRAEQSSVAKLGLAIESRRIDLLKALYDSVEDLSPLLDTTLTHLHRLVVGSKKFQLCVYDVVYEKFKQTSNERRVLDLAMEISHCLFQMNCPIEVAKLLRSLIDSAHASNTTEGILLAYQIAFNLTGHENHAFTAELAASPHLRVDSVPLADDAKATDVPVENPLEKWLDRLRRILTDEIVVDHQLQFLHRANATDLQILDHLKNFADTRNSIVHNGVVIAHSLMMAGSTSDTFLRNNLEWLKRANWWSKFTASASLGVVHKGNVRESRGVLSSYLPSSGSGVHSEGGALFALGIVHSNRSSAEIATYIEQYLEDSSNEVHCHGACLGLALISVGSKDERLLETFKRILFSDTAVGSEAAALAIGILMLGSGQEDVIEDLIAYAHDTTHERIVRACGLAVAFILYGRQQQANKTISLLLKDRDPTMRYGGCFAIGMAYCGCNDAWAVSRLLDMTGDLEDDPRRAAAICLAFVLCGAPQDMLRTAQMIGDTHDVHVRYGTSLALGYVFAGRAEEAAVTVLNSLSRDTNADIVRQAALMGLGFCFMQTSEAKHPSVAGFRTRLRKIASNKHEDAIIRFGSILAAGIVDAGGRNVTSSFYSASGHLRRNAVIGFALFSQLWFWYPLALGVSLTFTPTPLIGLTEEMKMPKEFTVESSAPPGLFSLIPPMTPPSKEDKKSSTPAVLSMMGKKRRRKVPPGATLPQAVEEEPEPEPKTSPVPEVPVSTATPTINNGDRVTREETGYLQVAAESRYQVVWPRQRLSGFVMLKGEATQESFVDTMTSVERNVPATFKP